MHFVASEISPQTADPFDCTAKITTCDPQRSKLYFRIKSSLIRFGQTHKIMQSYSDVYCPAFRQVISNINSKVVESFKTRKAPKQPSHYAVFIESPQI